jgi:hypothetical protein
MKASIPITLNMTQKKTKISFFNYAKKLVITFEFRDYPIVSLEILASKTS